jgi:hypothetical protein
MEWYRKYGARLYFCLWYVFESNLPAVLYCHNFLIWNQRLTSRPLYDAPSLLEAFEALRIPLTWKLIFKHHEDLEASIPIDSDLTASNFCLFDSTSFPENPWNQHRPCRHRTYRVSLSLLCCVLRIPNTWGLASIHLAPSTASHLALSSTLERSFLFVNL